MVPVPLSLPMFALNFKCSLLIGKADFSGGMRFSVELWVTPNWPLTRCTKRQLVHQTSTIDKSGIIFDEISCEGRESDIPRRRR